MSRRKLVFIETDEYSKHSIIGWDPGLRTFFAQVSSNSIGPDADTDEPSLMDLGNYHGEFEDLNKLCQELSSLGTLPDSLISKLQSDKNTEGATKRSPALQNFLNSLTDEINK